MGTLKNQEPRKFQMVCENHIISEINSLKNIAKTTQTTYDQVIATCNMLELRRKNDLYVNNGDAFDEQMAGLGKILNEFTNQYIGIRDTEFEEALLPKAVEKIAQAIKDGLGAGANAPTFLEAMAMQMGFKGDWNGPSIVDAIYNLKEE